ncbi:GGDEF domain-containing protein [Bradyrhizobium sp. Leo170]|uniref:GGDEF domain-containing protein n=1 Tax=Bradyrhizobium sp. Leo170 TaxID=1571199 RepID=UPI00102E2572|nr:GGDEF domain-containing protein [Bradyrhizobium sp. Leo170]TAI61311.1 GGDEF domain-containing protein [Bradyrhizobium sp. Leo170]
MLLDQFSILVAIGFSGASLGLTLCMMWVVGKSETHLLSWSIGLALIVAGVAFFGSIIQRYDANLLLVSFVLLMSGFGLLYAGSAKFCSSRFNWFTVFAVVGLGVLSTSAAFAMGYSGTGTIAANVVIGMLLLLTAFQYWTARAESPLLMAANATLYLIAALSFVACGYALAEQGQFVLTARPSNWAEDINSIVVIAGLTGIGTLSLTLNQARIANRHKSEAMTDALTGLLNRQALFDGPPGHVPVGTAVVAMDLDHFKTINDRFGHDSGDRTLKAFAEIIAANVRSDDLAARIGGEEFCIVMLNSSPRASAAVAERIRAQIEAMSVPTPLGPIRTTVSGGIAHATGSETIQSLLIRADEALYEAKTSGRNRVKLSNFGLAA